MSVSLFRNVALSVVLVATLGLLVSQEAFGAAWFSWCSAPTIACAPGPDPVSCFFPANVTCTPAAPPNDVCWASINPVGCVFAPMPCIGTCVLGGFVCTAPPPAIACG